MQNKKVLIIIVVVLLVLAAGASYYYQKKNSPKPGTQQQQQQGQDNKPVGAVYQQPSEEVKAKLVPTDFPFESGAPIITELQANSNQYSRVWKSSKSVADNKTIFENYLNKNGWVMYPGISEKGRLVITASKDQYLINVSATEIAKGQTEVSATFSASAQ
ncbi:MAG: hypothetical protein HY918_03845 [Candidatus Doudnabacteria bacterium]|nr:hypothetical protein [Candidatus Doudnabacteria bacterium]